LCRDIFTTRRRADRLQPRRHSGLHRSGPVALSVPRRRCITSRATVARMTRMSDWRRTRDT
jgi:hypothetical protein